MPQGVCGESESLTGEVSSGQGRPLTVTPGTEGSVVGVVRVTTGTTVTMTTALTSSVTNTF